MGGQRMDTTRPDCGRVGGTSSNGGGRHLVKRRVTDVAWRLTCTPPFLSPIHITINLTSPRVAGGRGHVFVNDVATSTGSSQRCPAHHKYSLYDSHLDETTCSGTSGV